MESEFPKDASQAPDVLEQLLTARFSCRAFLPQSVPRPTIARILRAAQKTASACNSQPWYVEITSGKATHRFRENMYAAASSGKAKVVDFPFPREYRGVYLARRRESAFQLYSSLGIARGDKASYEKQRLENFNFFGAPHVGIVHTEQALGVCGAIDCGGYVTTFVLAAQALGIATIIQGSVTSHCDQVRRHFCLGDNRRVVCGIAFGYPDHSQRINSYRTTRATIDDVASFHDE